MVGRAAVRAPWIFAAVPGAFSVDLEETALRFLDLLTKYQPPEFHISRARRFFNYFCDNLKWGTYVKNMVNREETLSGIERVLRGYFNETVDGIRDKVHTEGLSVRSNNVRGP
jgi:tRNA-dihydrouridine synthase